MVRRLVFESQLQNRLGRVWKSGCARENGGVASLRFEPPPSRRGWIGGRQARSRMPLPAIANRAHPTYTMDLNSDPAIGGTGRNGTPISPTFRQRGMIRHDGEVEAAPTSVIKQPLHFGCRRRLTANQQTDSCDTCDERFGQPPEGRLFHRANVLMTRRPATSRTRTMTVSPFGRLTFSPPISMLPPAGTASCV